MPLSSSPRPPTPFLFLSRHPNWRSTFLLVIFSVALKAAVNPAGDRRMCMAPQPPPLVPTKSKPLFWYHYYSSLYSHHVSFHSSLYTSSYTWLHAFRHANMHAYMPCVNINCCYHQEVKETKYRISLSQRWKKSGIDFSVY